MSAENVRTAILNVFKNNTAVTDGFKLQLVGLLTFTNGTATVTGINTAFRSSVNQVGDIKKGDYIRATTSSKWYKVLSVESPTSLTLDGVFAEATEASVIGYVFHLNSGVVRNIDFVAESRGIKIYHMAEVFKQENLLNVRQDAAYGFHVSAFFYEPDDAEMEVRKSVYSSLLRKAIEADLKAGPNSYLKKTDVAYMVNVSATTFLFHPQEEGQAYFTFDITTRGMEAVGS